MKKNHLKKQLVRFIKDFGLGFQDSVFGLMCDVEGEEMALRAYGYHAVRTFRYDYLKPYLFQLLDVYMGQATKNSISLLLNCDKSSWLIDKFIEIRNMRELTEFVVLNTTSRPYTDTYNTTTNFFDLYKTSAFNGWSSQNFNYQIDNKYGI